MADPTKEIAEIRGLILPFFEGNAEKADLWLTSKNPNLGNISPVAMVELGRFDKLVKWVKHQLSDNKPPI